MWYFTMFPCCKHWTFLKLCWSKQKTNVIWCTQMQKKHVHELGGRIFNQWWIKNGSEPEKSREEGEGLFTVLFSQQDKPWGLHTNPVLVRESRKLHKDFSCPLVKDRGIQAGKLEADTDENMAPGHSSLLKNIYLFKSGGLSLLHLLSVMCVTPCQVLFALLL